MTTASGPEWFEARQVIAYPDADTAVAALQAIRATITGCPEDRAERDDLGYAARVSSVHEAATGYEDSFTFSDTPDEGLLGTVYQVTRVGSALLVVTSDGHWSRDSVEDGVPALTAVTNSLTPLLCVFTQANC